MKKFLLTVLIFSAIIAIVAMQVKAQKFNGLALTPPMGWNSWNCWGLSVDQDKVKLSADALIKSGLAEHGWTYIANRLCASICSACRVDSATGALVIPGDAREAPQYRPTRIQRAASAQPPIPINLAGRRHRDPDLWCGCGCQYDVGWRRAALAGMGYRRALHPHPRAGIGCMERR